MEGAKQLGEWFSAVLSAPPRISQIFTVLAVPRPHLTTTERGGRVEYAVASVLVIILVLMVLMIPA